jgi:hypothetical protein
MTNQQREPRPARFGCTTGLFVWGVIAIAAGAYLIHRWAELHTFARVSAIMLVSVGSLMMAPLVVVVLLTLFVRRMLGRVASRLESAGEALIDRQKVLYGATHERRPATAEDFAPLDRDFYDSAAAQLVEMGYRQLGDIVDVTIEKVEQVSPVIRVLTSADGTTLVGLYHLRPRRVPERMKDLRLVFCDAQSEVATRGEFLITCNSQGFNQMTPPPKIHPLQLPLETSVQEVKQSHEARKQKYLAAHPDARFVRIDTLAEAMASQDRQQIIKNEFRSDIGYIDPEEVRRIARAGDHSEEIADQAAEAFDRARRNERGDVS